MTIINIRFLIIKNLKIILFSLCLRVVPFHQVPLEFNARPIFSGPTHIDFASWVPLLSPSATFTYSSPTSPLIGIDSLIKPNKRSFCAHFGDSDLSQEVSSLASYINTEPNHKGITNEHIAKKATYLNGNLNFRNPPQRISSSARRQGEKQIIGLNLLPQSDSVQETRNAISNFTKEQQLSNLQTFETTRSGQIDFDERLTRPSQVINDSKVPSSSLNDGMPLDANKIDESRQMIPRSVDVKTIETAIFTDRSLDQKFSGRGGLVELNKLILTIMNQVQMIFSFRSMKTQIKINIVLVNHLKDIQDPPSTENGDIDGYLGSFCRWQHNLLLQDRNLAWDHAILLTGLDLYKTTKNRNHSGVLGLAWVGGMCKQNYSCTINEAMSLESAFVIAHEMGHSLGILHDGQQNNCDRNNYIMSERTGAGKIHWSTCSNYYLNDAVRKRQLHCLDNERSPVDQIYNLSKMKPPGQVYNINDQCRLAFGNNYTAFVTTDKPFNSICRELWCVAGTWAKAAHPALEGSLCGDPGRYCIQGDCK